MKIITYNKNKEYEIKCSKEELLKLQKLIEGALHLHEISKDIDIIEAPLSNSFHPYTDYFDIEELNKDSAVKIGFNILIHQTNVYNEIHLSNNHLLL
jgi:hypothetical protein